jgi:hypothetical protein
MYRAAHPPGSGGAQRKRNACFDEALSGDHCMQGFYLLRHIHLQSLMSQELETQGEAVLDSLSRRSPATDQLFVVLEFAGMCLSRVRSPRCRSSSITAPS